MARSSKDSSNPETFDLLFDSDRTKPEADQSNSESLESRSTSSKKKRVSSKRSQHEEQLQEEPETSSGLSLFGEPIEPKPVHTSKENAEAPESFVAQRAPETIEQAAPVTFLSQEAKSLKNAPAHEECFLTIQASDPRFEAKPCADSLLKNTETAKKKLKPAKEPAETISVQETDEIALELSQPAPKLAQTNFTKKPVAYQVVARRYRPQAFDELIGQETIARALSNAIETNRVGHAYLFTGARGVGKTSCARIFAKALNCVTGPTTRPCLKCDSCISISTGEDVDVIEIDGASNRGVDEIRQLRQNATIAPSRSHYKIYIIDEVHMLTREAFNALLKTLEEPPARVKFIFCTTEPNKIPVTILSRCQRFDFNSINGVSIAHRLEQIAKQEGAQAEDGVFDVLARRANGSMRDAQSLLEQLLSFAPDYIAQSDVHNMLGSVDDRKIFNILNATVKGDSQSVFETLGIVARQGVDFGALIEQTFGVYRDLMVVASGCDSKELAYSPVASFEELKKLASEFGIRRILASLQILDQAIQRMRYSAQVRILAELAFARLCRLDTFQTIETLINQLKNGALPNVELNPSQPSSQTIQKDDKKKIVLK